MQERLTNKVNRNYFTKQSNMPTKYCETVGAWLGGKVLNKLGQLEDVEKELGIDLLTLFKVFTNGVYFRVNPVEGIKFDNFQRGCEFDKQTIIGLDENGYYFVVARPFKCYLKDYRKTWALTEEEL